MIALRWFLSHLTFFFSLFILSYLLFNLFQNSAIFEQKIIISQNDEFLSEKSKDNINLENELITKDIIVNDSRINERDIEKKLETQQFMNTVEHNVKQKVKQEVEKKSEFTLKSKLDKQDINLNESTSTMIQEHQKDIKHKDIKDKEVEKDNVKQIVKSVIKEIIEQTKQIQLINKKDDKNKLSAIDDISEPVAVADKILDNSGQVFTNNKQTIDELVSLLMPEKQLFVSKGNDKKQEINLIQDKLQLARNYFLEKEFKKSERVYLDLIKLEPEFTDFYSELSNLYFVNNEIKKYNAILVTLARLYIKNKDIKMARYIIKLLEKKAANLAKKLNQELDQLLSNNVLNIKN